jgi:hypothetical protein
MRGRLALPIAFGALAAMPVPAFCADVVLTSDYPAAYGDFTDARVENALSVGRKATGEGWMTIRGDTTVSGADNAISIWGELTVDPAALMADAARPGFFVQNPAQPSTLRVDTDPSYNWRWDPGTHWVSIGKPANSAKTEFDVRGPIYATEFKVSDSALDRLLSLDVQMEGPLPWAQVRAQAPPANWASPLSVLRIAAQPKIVLNSRSPGPVLVGTATIPAGFTNPNLKFIVADPYKVRGNLVTFSSRVLKHDIVPLSTSDIASMRNSMDAMDAILFRYKHEPDTAALHIGLVAEQAPPEILSETRDTVLFSQLIGWMLGAIQALEQENRRLEAEVSRLEREL